MQNATTHDVLHALLTLTPGRPVRPLAGVTVVPLFSSAAQTSSVVASAGDPLPGARALVQIEWREMDEPHPQHVVARNTSDQELLADVGSRLEGGMAARVVATTIALPAGTTTSVPVLTVGNRWWDEGPLTRNGHSHPVVTALLLHASRGWLSATARTLLTYEFAEALEVDDPQISLRDAAGFVLMGEGGALMGWIRLRSAANGAVPASVERTQPIFSAKGEVVLREVVDAVSEGAFRPHVVAAGRWGSDTVLLPQDPRFVNALAR